MTDKIEPLYKRTNSYSMEYMCTFNGKKCGIATQHFSDYAAAVDFLARNRKKLTFVVPEQNLCLTKNCPIWNQFLQAKTEQR